MYRAAPASLVECYGLNAAGGKRGEELVVAVDVIIEAMYEY